MDLVQSAISRFSLDRLLSSDLLALLRLSRRGPGEFIIRSGDPVRELLFLFHGRAKAYSVMDNGQSVLASFYEPFDVFGEAELFSSPAYALSVQAIEESLCLSLPVDAVLSGASRNHRLFMYLCGRLGAKLTDRFAAESINLRYPVEGRFASYLLASCDEEGLLPGSDDLGDIANFLGASYRQLGRVVRRFRDAGLLAATRGRLRVVDREGLSMLSGDIFIQTGNSIRPDAFAK